MADGALSLLAGWWGPLGSGPPACPFPWMWAKFSLRQHLAGPAPASGASDSVPGVSEVWEGKLKCSVRRREIQMQKRLYWAGE